MCCGQCESMEWRGSCRCEIVEMVWCECVHVCKGNQGLTWSWLLVTPMVDIGS